MKDFIFIDLFKKHEHDFTSLCINNTHTNTRRYALTHLGPHLDTRVRPSTHTRTLAAAAELNAIGKWKMINPGSALSLNLTSAQRAAQTDLNSSCSAAHICIYLLNSACTQE